MNVTKTLNIVKLSVRILWLLLGIYVLWVVVTTIQEHNKYDRENRICREFYPALEDGDTPKMLELVKLLPKRSDPRYSDLCWISPIAQEQAGQYDEALKGYQNLANTNFYINNHGRNTIKGRIAYKQGRYEDSFRFYSAYVAQMATGFGVTPDNPDAPSSIEGQKVIRKAITGEVDVSSMRLSPFLEFSEFRAFMEDEYAKLGTSGEYEFEMNVIRKIDESKDVLDKEINRPYELSGRLSPEKFRERLKKERERNEDKLSVETNEQDVRKDRGENNGY